MTEKLNVSYGYIAEVDFTNKVEAVEGVESILSQTPYYCAYHNSVNGLFGEKKDGYKFEVKASTKEKLNSKIEELVKYMEELSQNVVYDPILNAKIGFLKLNNDRLISLNEKIKNKKELESFIVSYVNGYLVKNSLEFKTEDGIEMVVFYNKKDDIFINLKEFNIHKGKFTKNKIWNEMCLSEKDLPDLFKEDLYGNVIFLRKDFMKNWIKGQ